MSKKCDDSEHDESQLMAMVQEFCTSNDFEEEFEAFAKEHSDVFINALNFQEGNEEHPLEFHEVYREYLNTFEGMIERFITKSGFTVKQFYDQCKDIMEKDEIWGTKRFFIETMLATSEYQNFFMLMKSEMRNYQSKANAKWNSSSFDKLIKDSRGLQFLWTDT